MAEMMMMSNAAASAANANPPAPAFSDLNAEQRLALLMFRLKNGQSWKGKLADGWLVAKYPGPLQQIRNDFGTHWLADLVHVPDYRIKISLETRDGCCGEYSVALDPQGKVATSRITWSPNEPDDETQSATFELFDGRDEKASVVVEGDFWRELESNNLDDELWVRVLAGEDLEGAVESMPISAPRMRM